MAIRFDQSGSIRINTSLPSHGMAVYGTADRFAALPGMQWFVGIHTSNSGSFVFNEGTLTVPNDDALINAIAFRDTSTGIMSIREWGQVPENFAAMELNQLFNFALIGYLTNEGRPVTKYAVQRVGGGPLLTTERTLGGYAWTDAKVHIGASSGNGYPARMRFSRIAILDEGDPDDSVIQQRFNDMDNSGDSRIYSYLAGNGSDLNDALQDDSGNGNHWAVNGQGVSLEANAHQVTSSLVITGTATMPDASGTVAPPAPTNLTAAQVEPGTILLSFTDPSSGSNAADEIVADVERLGELGQPGGYEPFTTRAGVTGGNTKLRIENLEAGRAYNVRVRAANRAGASLWSNIVQVTLGTVLMAELRVEPEAAGLQGVRVTIWRPPVTSGAGIVGEKILESYGNFDSELDNGAARVRVPLPQLSPPINPGDPLVMHAAYRWQEGQNEQQSDVAHDAIAVQV